MLTSDSNPVAVVLGANLNGLGIIRNFGRRGISTIVVDYRHYMIGNFSKYGRKHICSKTELPAVLESIGVHNRNNAILFPTSDEFLDVIIRHREDFAHYYHLPLPENDLLEKILDKSQFYRLVKPLDIDIPRTWCCDDINNLDQIIFPCILKPAYGHQFRQYYFNKKVIVVHEMTDLKKYLEYFSAIGLKMIIQEIVPGKDENQISVSVYIDRNSVPVTAFVSRKVRQNPIKYGVGTYVEPCREDSLEEKTLWLLSRIGYKGIAEVEYRYDELGRKYKLIEINPRPWEQNELASRMGRDVIFAAYCDYSGRPFIQNRVQREKMVWVFMFRDMLAAFSYIRNKQLTIIDYLKSYRTAKVSAVGRFDDPLPVVGLWYFGFIKGILSLFSQAERLTLVLRDKIIKLFSQRS